MSSGKPPASLPEVTAKLSKPVKQSAFEKSKADAEAKRKRDEAETAAVYEEFVKSFDHDEDETVPSAPGPSRPRHGFSGVPPAGFDAGKRHFAMTGAKRSGPGTLDAPAGGFGTKRSIHNFSRGVGDAPERLGGALQVSDAFNNASDDEDEVQRDAIERAELRAVAKPQLRLANLPPGISPAEVKALIPAGLLVEAVKFETMTGSNSAERRITNAVVTLSRDSAGNAIEAAVSSLQNRYLGCGYWLSAQRHLSSAVLNPVAAPSSSSSAPQPFGAKQVEQSEPPRSHGYQRNFAPPSSYDRPGGRTQRSETSYVPVTPPDDIRVLRQIQSVAECVVKYGAEFEALLLQRPDVQRDERWAWLWDSRSVGAVWYRWRLWELMTQANCDPRKEAQVEIFGDGAAWKVPDRLPFESVVEMDQFVSDSDYNSSEEDEEDGRREQAEKNGSEGDRPYLTPLERSKLVFLLARLPTNLSKLRKGDIARLTAFALTHSDQGPGEIVDLITSNVGTPMAYMQEFAGKEDDAPEPPQGGSLEEGSLEGGPDTSAGSLIGLYVISDILSSASTTVFRHSWRYRGLFEKALKERQVFSYLGALPEKQRWGRLRAEKWKRSINLILNHWEGWCVFPARSQELFVHSFEHPLPEPAEAGKEGESANKGAWKVVVGSKAAVPAGQAEAVGDGADDVEGEAVGEDDVEPEAMEVDDDVEGEPVEEDDVEGEPLQDEDLMGEPVHEGGGDTEAASGDAAGQDGRKAAEAASFGDGRRGGGGGEEITTQPGRNPDGGGRGSGPRKRMRAVDMFADADDSDG